MNCLFVLIFLVIPVILIQGEDVDNLLWSNSLPPEVRNKPPQTIRFNLTDISRSKNKILSTDSVKLEGTPIKFYIEYVMNTWNTPVLVLKIKGIHENRKQFGFIGCGEMVIVNQKNRDDDTVPLRWVIRYDYYGAPISQDFVTLEAQQVMDTKKGWRSEDEDVVFVDVMFAQYKFSVHN